MTDLRSLVGIARSLVIYRARPWRTAALARFYAAMIGPGDLAFDVGAHAGNRTRAMLRAGARVVAVEPQAAFQALLARDLPKGATLVRAAAGAAPGEARLAVSRLHPTLASLARGHPDRMAEARGFEHVRWDAAETVPVTTLDALIDAHGLPRFVKIDVEGYEAEVLRGLSRPVRWIAFEYLPAARDVTTACLDQIEALGPYRYNLVTGEGRGFALPDWTDVGGLRAALAARAADGRSGDVYARLEPADAG